MHKQTTSRAAILLTIAAATTTAANGQFPDFSDLKVPSVKEATGVKKLMGGGLGCISVGALGYFGGKKFSKMLGKKRPLTKKEQDRFILGAALAGCAVGAAAGVRIIENMSESAKQAQLDAWTQAQQQSSAVRWQDPNDESTRGTTELTDIESLPSGKTCGFRRDIVTTSQGTVEPQQRVCQDDDGDWQPQFS